jgi:hypothetical protein
MPLLLLVFCTVTSGYTFRYTVTYHYLIPLNNLYNYQSLLVVVSIHRPRGIFILQTSDFEIQTLQLAFQTSKFGLQTCSLHDNFLCTQAQTIFFRTILIVKTALASCLTSTGGHQPNLLKGILIISFTPNYCSNWPITRFYFISGTKVSIFSYDGDHFWWLIR